jgi:hypothetical protein
VNGAEQWTAISSFSTSSSIRVRVVVGRQEDRRGAPLSFISMAWKEAHAPLRGGADGGARDVARAWWCIPRAAAAVNRLRVHPRARAESNGYSSGCGAAGGAVRRACPWVRCSSGWESGADAAWWAAAAVSAPRPDDFGRCARDGIQPVMPRIFSPPSSPKALAKRCIRDSRCRAHTPRPGLRAFDDVTAPLHGFEDTDDYWTRARQAGWRISGADAGRERAERSVLPHGPAAPREVGPAVLRGKTAFAGGHCAPFARRRFSRQPRPWLPARRVFCCRRADDAERNKCPPAPKKRTARAPCQPIQASYVYPLATSAPGALYGCR